MSTQRSLDLEPTTKRSRGMAAGGERGERARSARVDEFLDRPANRLRVAGIDDDVLNGAKEEEEKRGHGREEERPKEDGERRLVHPEVFDKEGREEGRPKEADDEREACPMQRRVTKRRVEREDDQRRQMTRGRLVLCRGLSQRRGSRGRTTRGGRWREGGLSYAEACHKEEGRGEGRPGEEDDERESCPMQRPFTKKRVEGKVAQGRRMTRVRLVQCRGLSQRRSRGRSTKGSTFGEGRMSPGIGLPTDWGLPGSTTRFRNEARTRGSG